MTWLFFALFDIWMAFRYFEECEAMFQSKRKKSLLALILLGYLVAAPYTFSGDGALDMLALAKREAHKLVDLHASGCVNKKNVSAWMGDYRVDVVSKYGGGLTKREQAMQRLGSTMIMLTPGLASVTNNKSIAQPRYDIICQPATVEGEVAAPSQRYSNFYGFETDRDAISVLRVFDEDQEDLIPYYEFELITTGNQRELWYMSDGWLYKLKAEW